MLHGHIATYEAHDVLCVCICKHVYAYVLYIHYYITYCLSWLVVAVSVHSNKLDIHVMFGLQLTT